MFSLKLIIDKGKTCFPKFYDMTAKSFQPDFVPTIFGGVFPSLAFTATSDKQKVYRFATIINTHAKLTPSEQPRILKDGCIEIGDWNIKVNLSAKGVPSFSVCNMKKGENLSIDYKGEATVVKEYDKKRVLVDKVPNLEI